MLATGPPGQTRRPGEEFSARLHPLGDRHAEQAKALGQHVQREGAKREPAHPQRLGLGLKHRALLVERGEQAGHVEQVRAQAMRFRGLAVITNTPPRSQQRSPGPMQANAIMEPVVTKAAKKLGLDQLAIRRINSPEGKALYGPPRPNGQRGHVTSAFVKQAIDRGINYIDTANNYGRGASERTVGAFVKPIRDQVVIGTKIYAPFGPNAEDRGLSADAIRRAVDISLARLGTDYIDILYLHRPDASVEPGETAGALAESWRQGKIRAIGTSTFPNQGIDSLQSALAAANAPLAVCDQAPYSLLERSVEVTAQDALHRWGMEVVVWSPLAEGLLTGKYQDPDADGRLRRWMLLQEPRYQAGVDRAREFQTLAHSFGLTLPELALRWLLRRPLVGCMLVGPRTIGQLAGYLDAIDGEFPDGAEDQVDAILGSGETVLHHYAT